ncbi:GGDEF domain-containing protein [Vibrio sp. HN007]|uniref:GGDEF domain-containing protein n=1 Tax=Vibrio iocasae TaxID=3098914 RepID=UPI0035D44F6A
MALLRNGTVSKKLIFAVPSLFALVFVTLLLLNYVERIQLDIQREMHQLETSLMRSVKIVTSLDYNISSQFAHKADPAETGVLQHHIEYKDGVCRAWPVVDHITDTGETAYAPAVDMDYMVLGPESLCREGSPLFSIAKRRIALAPILSFLHDLGTDIQAVHYVSAEKFIITSPEKFAKELDKSTVLNATNLPFWEITSEHRDKITVVGPYKRAKFEGELLSLSSPVIAKDIYYGAVVVDINVDRFLQNISGQSNKYRLINSGETPLPDNAYFVHPIIAEGVNFSHTLYYEFDLKEEVRRFFRDESADLFTVLALLVIAIIGLFYFKIRLESRYFKDLAERDPMTGLLNRRGLELHCNMPSKQKYVAIGIYDVDDFKKINDTYGHDKGDEVLCFVADRISDSVRESDAVARFGGEEFVVYLRGNNHDAMVDVLERVRVSVTENSSMALPDGFTISGGVSISLAEERVEFEKQFKEADEKLYQAKTSGKNQVVV